MITTTADYLVGDVIGEGSFGRVVHGVHKPTSRDVAIKVVEKAGLKQKPHILQSVLQEQKLLKQLRYLPSVVSMWASFHDQHCVYLVMECAKGGNLDDAIKHGLQQQSAAWLPTAKHYARQIVQGLDELYANNIIHADLKPENVLVTDRGQIQLADFGSAIVFGEKVNHGGPANMPRGTCDYACPELLRGTAAELLTNAVDLWSFGCILYAMFARTSPFHAPSDALAVERICSFARVKCVTKRAESLFNKDEARSIPGEWRTLIGAFLDPEPAGRGASKAPSALVNEISLSALAANDSKPASLVRPPLPGWLEVKVESGGMKDGADGWSVFLL